MLTSLEMTGRAGKVKWVWFRVDTEYSSTECTGGLRVKAIGTYSYHFDLNGCVVIYLSVPVDSDQS
jgi:hypothetical protein